MTDFNAIPLIDFAGARARDPARTATIAREVYDACTTAGFFYMKNHGVPQTVIDGAVAAGRAFFSQPIERKRDVAVNPRHRGFNQLGDATMYGAKKPDHKEFYSVGLELPEDDPNVLAGEPLRGPNNWPSFLPAFRPAVYTYYEAIGECGRDLLRVVALSLGVDGNFFAPKYTKRLQRTQIVYYPPQPPDLGDDQFGVAAHTDYGCITLLWQDDNGGLQVRERSSGRWIEAVPIPGTLVINVGDLLGRWTNDRFMSTPHRVINRSGGSAFRSRRSTIRTSRPSSTRGISGHRRPRATMSPCGRASTSCAGSSNPSATARSSPPNDRPRPPRRAEPGRDGLPASRPHHGIT